MSWGERSCKRFGKTDGKCKPKFESCNVDCPLYEWDRATKPDSRSRILRRAPFYTTGPALFFEGHGGVD